ncbi:hypothetical protein J4G07_06295 [Candidatus Poribacteria bacterium]|nr:hypothetical protein [Candidatus Poribacteria bacterium]
MQENVKAAPTVIYPESDGKPMAETEYHRDIMIDFIQMLKHYFRNVNDVHGRRQPKEIGFSRCVRRLRGQ